MISTRVGEISRAQWKSKGVNSVCNPASAFSRACVVGNFGRRALLRYTAYGESIKHTARLETQTKFLGTDLCSAKGCRSAEKFKGRPVGDLIAARDR